MDFSIREVISTTLSLARERKLLLLKGVIPAFVGFMMFGGLMSLSFGQFGAADEVDSPSGWMFLLMFLGFVFILLQLIKAFVNSHRVYILNDSPSLTNIAKWRRSDTLFLKASIKLIVLYIVLAILLFVMIIPMLFGDTPEENEMPLILVAISIIGQLLVAYVASRVSIILPAAAIDSRIILSEAWELSATHHLKLLVLIGLIPIGTNTVISLLPQFDSIFYSIIVSTIWFIVAMLELGLLSVSYNRLRTIVNEESEI